MGTMTALARCILSLSVCHQSVDQWEAANKVAQQHIAIYVSREPGHLALVLNENLETRNP
jgi:hypothetical protein